MKKKDDLEDFRFNITDKLEEIMIELMISQQMLRKEDFPQKYRKLLAQYIVRLQQQLLDELKATNKEELKRFREMIHE